MPMSPSPNAPESAAAPEDVTAESTPSLVEALLRAPEVQQTFGIVEGRDERVFLVRAGADLLRTARSKSCLVEPSPGDTVLVARSEHHGSYLLAVLASPAETSTTMVSVEGDLALRSKTGKVTIAAAHSVNVVAGRNIAATAPEIAAHTMKATLFADTLSYVGRTIDSQVERVRHVGRRLELVVDIVTARMKHSDRTIEEIERVKAKELHVRAEGTLNVHAKNTLMTAEKLVKFDGEQIHLG